MSTLRKSRPQGKIVMEGVLELPQLPKDFAITSWKQLESSLNDIISLKPMLYGREFLYKLVETLCNNNDTSFILENLLNCLYKYISSEQAYLLNFQGGFQEFADQYDSHWEKFQQNIERVLSVFMYLEGAIKCQGDKGFVHKVYSRYTQDLISCEKLYSRLIQSILLLINEERKKEIDHKLHLKRLILMLEKLGLYKDRFYDNFISETDFFFKELVRDVFENMMITDYLKLIQLWIKKEQERIENYLSVSSKKESIEILENRMIKDIAESIVEKGMDYLIENNLREDLKVLYMIFKRVNMLHIVEAGFERVVRHKGNEIVKPVNDEKLMITNILNFRDKIESIMIYSFENNMKFKYSNKSAWEDFINKNQEISVLCAKDLDENLKKGSKIKLTDQELETRIDGIINVFKFINSKDIFEAVYFNHLAKRLLLDKSKSADIENAVIIKLKAECGSTFISRIHNMQKDVDLSKTYMENFRKEFNPYIDFHVWTLTGSSWPKMVLHKPILPHDMQILQEQYTRFYTNNMKKRILTWNNPMSYCEIQANLKNGNKSLTVSLNQTLMLLLFNNHDMLTFKQISEFISVPPETIKKELLQICLKSKILLKQKKNKNLELDEEIRFNHNFAHKFYKITINSIQIKENRIETRQTVEKVLSERQFIVDAAIVRIMKSRKVITHSALLSETFAIIRFNISAVDVKKRIEKLIEQEYIRRDSDDKTVYHYIS